MRLQLRAVLAVVGAVLLVLVSMPQGAQAQEAPSITVTPSTGLIDGQTVTVTGTGFQPGGGRWPGSVCRAEVLDLLPSVSDVNALCGAVSVVELLPNATGAFVTSMVVLQQQRTFSGGTIECGQSDCVVLFLDVAPGGVTLLGSAATPISFGPPVPQSKADCKSGGWRNLANDQGRSFRNQGQCVSYVVAHPR